MIIDLDQQATIDPKQLRKRLYVEQIVFQFTPDSQILVKLQKIDQYIPYLYEIPTIKTTFRVKDTKSFKDVYGVVAVGGTFDHFHLGHQILLLFTALSASTRIYIGLTGQTLLVKKKSKQMLESWSLRMKNVEAFVKSIKPELQVIIFELKDLYGVTGTEPNIDALVVSEQTFVGGQQVNQYRKKQAMKTLKLIICPTISPNKNIQSKLSSSSIREYLLNKNSFTIELYSQYRSYYDELVNRLQITNKEHIQNWWSILYHRYSEHWRFYHSNQHILRLLQDWHGLTFKQKRQKLSKRERNIIQLTIFFHDVVYKPNSNQNEEDSAKLAQVFIEEVLQSNAETDNLKQIVSQLILETKNHIPSSELSQIVYDLDMGILASEPKRYQEYARAIKKQYQPLFGEQYSEKRAHLLKKWQQQKHFFSSHPQNLQSNLSWEIFCLENHDL